MPLVIETERPPLRTEEDGTVRVGQSRVTLDVLLSAYNGGAGPEQIVRQFSTVSLADAYAVIGYYLRNRDRVDAYLREREERADDLRKQIEAACPPDGIRQRLLERRVREAGGK